jgi:hypothetical protein
MASLLNGSHFNYLLLGSPTDPSALDRVILIAKSGGLPENPAPAAEQASAVSQNVYARPMAPMAAPAAAGGNTVVVEGQDAQDEAADESADATDDTQADDQTDQTDQGDDQAAAADDQQQQQDGQQQVKTPEQLLQELQQRQQQMQQQGIQPGVPPGMRQFPPGLPGQPGDGTNPPGPPHI